MSKDTVHNFLLMEGGPAGLTQEEIRENLPDIGRMDLAYALDELAKEKKIVVDESHPDGWNRYKANMKEGGPVTSIDVMGARHDDTIPPELEPEPKRKPNREHVKAVLEWGDDNAKTYKEIMVEVPWLTKNQVHSAIHQLVKREEARTTDKKRPNPGGYRPIEQYVLARPRPKKKVRKKPTKKAKVSMPDPTPVEQVESLEISLTPEKAHRLSVLWGRVASLEASVQSLERKKVELEVVKREIREIEQGMREGTDTGNS